MTHEPNDATPFLPERRSLKALREAAAGCRGCHLWRNATQTVFGEGAAGARLMLVGEQPGDREDRDGHPFVGPAGRELDRALEEVGIDRREAYVTNVVKHFKFAERGRRRIHATPKKFEVDACTPWLGEELRVVKPEALVVLGATAGKALFGSKFTIRDARAPDRVGPRAVRDGDDPPVGGSPRSRRRGAHARARSLHRGSARRGEAAAQPVARQPEAERAPRPGRIS
jgi:DNA polymerase